MINFQYINKFWEDSVDKQYLIETSDHSVQITNQNLHSQTITITESLTSGSGGGLSFGDCEASCLKFRVTRDNAPLVRKWLNVYVTLEGTNTPFKIGRYKVVSDKPVDGNRYREITAYDKIYFVMNRDCTRWYKRMFRENDTMTIKEFRDAFFSRFSIDQKPVTLINDYVEVHKSKISKLSGRDIIKVIGEMNGVFGHFDRDGEFKWILLDSLSHNPYPISRSWVVDLEYEDYDIAQMQRIEILKASGELAAYAGASEDETDDDQNIYVVESNFITNAISNPLILSDIANNLFATLNTISFRPVTVCDIKGNPCIEVGDYISFTTNNTTISTFLLQRIIKGTQSLMDSISSESGENYRQDQTTSTQAKIKDVQETAAVSYVIDNEEYPGHELPYDGKVGDIAFKDVTASQGKTPMYRILSEGKYSRMTDEHYIRPAGQLHVSLFDWDSQYGGYRVDLEGRAVYFYSGYGWCNWNYGMPVLTVELPEPGTYKWHCMISSTYSENSAGDSDEATFVGLIFGSDPATGGDTVGGVPSNPPVGVGTVGDQGNLFVNADVEQGTLYGYEGTFTIRENTSWYVDGKVYLYVYYHRLFAKMAYDQPGEIMEAGGSVSLRMLYFEKIDPETGQGDGGFIETFDRYIDGFYAKVKGNGLTSSNSNTRGASRSVGDGQYADEWKELQFVQKVDTSENSGLAYGRPASRPNAQRELSLQPNVMRAWFKADPPQIKRKFNQYCVRYTGKPDSNISISLQSNTGWLNKSIKQDSEGVFTIKSGGTVSGSAIEYCAYKITGLTSGKRYYFNFKCNFKDGTTFGSNFEKGLGLVFNTTGTIDTDDWTGDANTFDENNLYYSMRRTTAGNFADFSFVATASTMYMCVVVADIASGNTSSLTLSKMVISQTERAYVRDFYIFDTVENDWLPYKPFGSGADSGGDSGASSLADLDDVNLSNLVNGQTLVYDANAGEWKNASGGGGGGSTVVVTPLLNTGVPIAKISVDGVEQTLYAPQGGGTGIIERNNGVSGQTDRNFIDKVSAEVV